MMMQCGKISVLMPNYNHARYLDQSISAILGQTYRNLELFIHDDASTDDSRQVIEKYAAQDLRVKPVFSEVNVGVLAGLNRLLAMADGEFIVAPAADDFVSEPSMYAELIDLLSMHASAGAVCAKSIEIHADSKDEDLWPYGHAHREGLIAGAEFAEAFMKGALWPNTFASVIRRSALAMVGGWNQNHGAQADTISTVHIGVRIGIVFVDKVYTRMRIRKGRYGDSEELDRYFERFALMETIIREALLPFRVPSDWINTYRTRTISHKLRTPWQRETLKLVHNVIDDLSYWKVFFMPEAYSRLKEELFERHTMLNASLTQSEARAHDIFRRTAGQLT